MSRNFWVCIFSRTKKWAKKRRNRMGSPFLFLFFYLMVQCEHGENVDFSGFSRCPKKYTFLDTFVRLQLDYRTGNKLVNTFLKKIFWIQKNCAFFQPNFSSSFLFIPFFTYSYKCPKNYTFCSTMRRSVA